MKVTALLTLFALPAAVVGQLCEAECSNSTGECVFHASVSLNEGQLGKYSNRMSSMLAGSMFSLARKESVLAATLAAWNGACWLVVRASQSSS